MRTDVKVGLVCAFVIVMGAVIYFVAQPAHPAKPRTTTDSLASSNTPATSPATAPGAAGSVGGPFILPPGPVSAGPTTVPDATGTPAGSTASTGGFGAFGTPSMTGTTGSTGTTGTTASTSGTTSGIPPFGTFSSGATASSASPSATPRGTVEFSSPPPGTPSFGGVFGAGSTAASTGTTYVIQKDDMLEPIAKHFGVTVSAILAANPGLDAKRLKIKQTINIPTSTASATPATRPAERTGSHTDATARTATARSDTATASAAAAKPGASYKIKKSDTLMTIARNAYGSEKDWKRIYQANKSSISDPNLVPVGLVIKIPQ